MNTIFTKAAACYLDELRALSTDESPLSGVRHSPLLRPDGSPVTGYPDAAPGTAKKRMGRGLQSRAAKKMRARARRTMDDKDGDGKREPDTIEVPKAARIQQARRSAQNKSFADNV